MRKACAGLLALALACLAGPAFAQAADTVERASTENRPPNFLGATGLLLAPDAYTQGDRVFSAHIHGTTDFIGGGALAGIGSRAEVGFFILDGDEDLGDDTDVLFNAKYQFLTETRGRPAIAAGVIDAFDQLDVDPSWYVVASKYFTRSQTEQKFALKGHIGFGGGIYDEEIFAGAEPFFNQSLSAMAEFVNDDFNIGARWTRNGFTATIGLFDFEDLGGGLAYTARFR
jgi:hypothetical protein